MNLNATSFAGANPSLFFRGAEHALEASLMRNVHSHVRLSKVPGLSRAKRRKIANRRRRWFVENIVMHHKRIHDKNRQQAIDDIRKKALEKREALKKKKSSLNEALLKEKKTDMRWSQKVDIRERGMSARDRIQSRRNRAQSRWMSISDLVDDKKSDEAS